MQKDRLVNPLFSESDFEDLEIVGVIYPFFEKRFDEKKLLILERWQKGIQNQLVSFNEEQMQADFLNQIFGEVLDYSYDYIGNVSWNLMKEEKTLADATKADGVLGYFSSTQKEVRTIIELKNLSADLDAEQSRKERITPIDQAFGYASKMGELCRWVIVSNFNEIRLYRYPDKEKCQVFFLENILEKNAQNQYIHLPIFFYLLYFGQLFQKNEIDANIETQARTEKIYRKRAKRLLEITNLFYKEYKAQREIIFADLRKNNPKIDAFSLLSYTQSILDRIIFMRFASDLELIERDALITLKQNVANSITNYQRPYWRAFYELSECFDVGFKSTITPFNGELFKPIPDFDKLKLTDKLIGDLINFLSKYNFKNDLKVDILGHIFEQSISDIEATKRRLTAEASGEMVEVADGKRNQDGIFYTLKSITTYILDQTLGKWIQRTNQEILQNLSIDDITTPNADLEKWKITKPEIQLSEVLAIHATYWNTYKSALDNLRLLDPACGSGAFLNAAFDVLFLEYLKVEKNLSAIGKMMYQTHIQPTAKEAKAKKEIKVTKKEMLVLENASDGLSRKEIAQIRKSIVLNNLFGVDLNAESIEITKLSLYLKIAEKGEKLPNLRTNIKIGNSLISDKMLSDSAFDWQETFKEILTSQGGFDIIVGNPPYFNIPANHLLKKSKYFPAFQSSVVNIAALFSGLAIDLLKKEGFLSFIIPKSFLTVDSWLPLRKLLLNYKILLINDVGAAFAEVGIEQSIFALQKTEDILPEYKVEICENNHIINQILQRQLQASQKFLIISEANFEIIQKIEKNSIRLEEIAEMPRGITLKSSLYSDEKLPNTVQVLGGTNLQRYLIKDGGKRKPNKYLDSNHPLLQEKASLFSQKRIIYQNIPSSVPKIVATIEDGNFPTDDTLNNLILQTNDFDLSYILAILNSKLMVFYLRFGIINQATLTVHLDKPYIGKIPIRNTNEEVKQEIIILVNQLCAEKSSNEDTIHLENQIDLLVYQIYELTENDIAVLESSIEK